MLTGKFIVSCSHTRWDDKWSEKQSVLRHLARQGNTVMMVEPARHWREARGAGPVRELRTIEDRLYVWSPPRWLPGFYGTSTVSRAVDWLRWIRLRQIGRRIARGKRPILYLWHPDFLDAIGRLRERAIVYHKFDRFPITGEPTPEFSRRERTLIGAADVCLAVSEQIIAMDPMFSGFHWVPNGAEFELFREAMESPIPEPEDLARIPRPRLGYTGNINSKVDLVLLEHLARQLPQCSFVLAGPVRLTDDERADWARLESRPNVHVLGLKAFDVYPRYVAGLDVGIMPYSWARAPWVEYGYPLKLHEYLACGLPVVSADLPSVREFSGVVRIAQNLPQWVAAIEHALAEREPRAVARRIEVARQNSWSRRVAYIAELIDGALARRAGERSRAAA